MLDTADDIRIKQITALDTPAEIIHAHPRTEAATCTVLAARAALHRNDGRLAVFIGPCSIHNPDAAMDYAARLVDLRRSLGDRLEIIMRVYFEKPRTTVSRKGLINDPNLDGSYDVERGLRLARRLLLDINNLGLPAGCKFLDTMMPQ